MDLTQCECTDLSMFMVESIFSLMRLSFPVMVIHVKPMRLAETQVCLGYLWTHFRLNNLRESTSNTLVTTAL